MQIEKSLQLRESRFINNGLVNHFATVDDCVKSQLGVQAQYTNSALMAILLRTQDDITVDDIYNAENIIRAWVHRVTVHIIDKADFLSINQLRRFKKCWVHEYLQRDGIDYRHVLDYIDSLEYADGIPSKALSEMIKNKFGRSANDWSRSLILANINERIYGKMAKGGVVYKKFDADYSERQSWHAIFERYLKTYGPATLSDFSHWSGVGSTILSQQISTNQINYFQDNNKIYYYINNANGKVEYPIILSKFDPLLVAYKDKSWILGDIDAKTIWRKAGQIEAVIVAESGIIATWRMKCGANSAAVTVMPIRKISKKMITEIEAKFKRLASRMNRQKFSFIVGEVRP